MLTFGPVMNRETKLRWVSANSDRSTLPKVLSTHVFMNSGNKLITVRALTISTVKEEAASRYTGSLPVEAQSQVDKRQSDNVRGAYT